MAFYSCMHDSVFLACEMPRLGCAMRVPWYFTRESACSHVTGNVHACRENHLARLARICKKMDIFLACLASLARFVSCNKNLARIFSILQETGHFSCMSCKKIQNSCKKKDLKILQDLARWFSLYVVHANTRRELRVLVSCLLACTRM